MIPSPATIPIWNETDVTRDVVFRHCKPYSKLMWQTDKTGIKEIKPLSKARKPRFLAAIHTCPVLAVKSAG
jgi:hypothetical protein